MKTFIDAITTKWPDYVIAPGACPDRDCCGDHPADSEDLQMQDEGGFSWQPCESCGSTLGGDRHPAHAIHKDAFGPEAKRPDDVTHIEICADCLCYHANGNLPQEWES